MTGLDFEDRRIFARFPLSLPLEYSNLGSRKTGQAETLNISANGMGILTDRKLTPATSLYMWLSIPNDSRQFYTTGEVVWMKRIKFHKYSVGIKLRNTELMAVSRVLHASRPEQNVPAENFQKNEKTFLERCLNILGLNKL